MSPGRKRQLWAALVLGPAVLVLGALAFFNIQKNLVYYWTPEDLLARGEAAKGAAIRLGGVVCNHTLEWNATTMQLHFKMGMDADGHGQTVEVVSSSAPPQMLREGIGVLVEGRYDGARFAAERLMVKHANDYHPAKDGKAPHEIAGASGPPT